MSFSFHKMVSQLPSVLEPNGIYTVRVGRGFDLYVTDMTGSVAHKLNSLDEERLKLYFQSQNGLVSNGNGMRGDNTNFTSFKMSTTAVPPGHRCFYADAPDTVYTLDEFIAVDPTRKYRLNFNAYGNYLNGTLSKAYALIECYDMDKNRILPSNLVKEQVQVSRVVKKGTNYDLTLRPNHVSRFKKLFDEYKNKPNVKFYLLALPFYSKSTFEYSLDYSRKFLASNNQWGQTTFNEATGTWSGITFDKGASIYNGQNMAIAVDDGEQYAYPMRAVAPVVLDGKPMYDSKVEGNWTNYSSTFPITGVALPGTWYIKIGWRLNCGLRPMERAYTYIYNVSFTKV